MNALNLYMLSRLTDPRTYGMYYGALSGESERKYKLHEIKSLKSFVCECMKRGCTVSELDGFFYGFIIDQIGKEFDILKIGNGIVLNVELKSWVGNLTLVEEQLKKNDFYLAHLNCEQYFFTYNSNDGAVYTRTQSGEFKRARIEDILAVNKRISAPITRLIEDLFTPSRYFVSPTGEPERFLSGEYFLTVQQQQIKSKLLEGVKSIEQNAKICGAPGTGKSLLLFDVALELAKQGKVGFVVHGDICDGHAVIQAKTGIRFLTPGEVSSLDLNGFNYLLIDEAHLLSDGEFAALLQKSEKRQGDCIFCFEKSDIVYPQSARAQRKRLSAIKGAEYHLSGKIRVNEKLNAFVCRAFDKNRIIAQTDNGEVTVIYSKTAEQTRTIAAYYKANGYLPLSAHSDVLCATEKSATSLRGGEVERVAVVIDGKYNYNSSGFLSVSGTFPEELYLAMTRAKSGLLIIVQNNLPVFDWLIRAKCKK